MKQLLYILFTLCIPFLSSAQENNTIIKGKVISGDQPPAYVTIQAGKTGTQTNEQGEYTLSIPAGGKISLQFSSVGFETFYKTVTVQSGETRVINATLVRSGETLQNVEIIGRRETGYKNTTWCLMVSRKPNSMYRQMRSNNLPAMAFMKTYIKMPMQSWLTKEK